MSDIEHSKDLAESETYPSVEAGMEIITGNGIILGRAISGDYDPQSESFRLLFFDSIHPILNFCSSIYELPTVSILTIGHNRIVIAGDVIPEIVETRVGIFRFIGLVASLNSKIERKKRSYHQIERKNLNYHRLEIDSPEERLRQRRVAIEANNSTDRIDWANDGWEYNMDKIDRDEDFWSDNLDWNDDDPNDFDKDRTDDEDLPGAGVLRPKKPNPNLPPLMMLVDDDDDSPGETLRERF
jgi:hypothetical protein